MPRQKVLVVWEDQHDDGSGQFPDEPRIVWSETLPLYVHGAEKPFGVEFTTPDGKTLVVPEGSTAKVVRNWS